MLHKTNPTARRSGFADVNISANLRRMKCLEKARRAWPQVIRLEDHLRGARIDLLFTMSDNLRATGKAESALNVFLTNEFWQATFAVLKSGSANRSGHCSQTIGRAGWWSQTGSNRRPPACKAGALPTELWPRPERPAFAEAIAGNLRSLQAGVPTEAA